MYSTGHPRKLWLSNISQSTLCYICKNGVNFVLNSNFFSPKWKSHRILENSCVCLSHFRLSNGVNLNYSTLVIPQQCQNKKKNALTISQMPCYGAHCETLVRWQCCGCFCTNTTLAMAPVIICTVSGSCEHRLPHGTPASTGRLLAEISVMLIENKLICGGELRPPE